MLKGIQIFPLSNVTEHLLQSIDIVVYMADSKRTNGLINANLQKEDAASGNTTTDNMKLDMIIVSHLFWPSFKEENVILPDTVKR
jgi:hypothetical protein